MKNIAILHFAYPPNTGGVESVIHEQALFFAESGMNVLVLTGSGEEKNPKIKLVLEDSFQSVLKLNPVLYQRVTVEGIIDNEFYKLSELILDRLEKHLADRDVVIVHNMLTLLHNVPFIYAFRTYAKKHPEKRIITWMHDHTYTGFDRIRISEFKLDKLVHELLTKKIENIIYVAISQTFKNLLLQVMELNDEDIKVIPNGVNLKDFLEINEPIWSMIKKYNLFNRFPLILSPVNILDRKNIEYSLDIVSNLKKSYPNILYLISGNVSKHRKNKDYFEKLQKQVIDLKLESNVLFLTGQLPGLKSEQIHDLYSISDAVFYFSKSENFGLPLIEACLTKTPIFLSDLNVFHEVAGDNQIYINTANTSAEKTAIMVKETLESNNLIKLAAKMRSQYNLEAILTNKLLPLL